ncbi:phenylacetaldoxime dehydratase [Massarina eburnea CBS 473.64]|uniref:Phenylacetaldoxime dehydratase n=1 Tax=Massarina eburnea CBS 473.64 TaxID=1395130 RepID=A0A6A6S5R9_9PLEO|nr:phenylacetaldoxime dehydratase [Massarina eburnea CBS 473.64]
MLESAIPEHYRKERTCPVSTPPNYEPPFPSYCARFPAKMESLVLAIIGAQYASSSSNDGAGISTIKKFMTGAPDAVRPSFWEVAAVTDKKGAYNIAVLAYWPGADIQKKWAEGSGFQTWWDALDAEQEKHGWFVEVLSPSLERFETVFSNHSAPEGAANMQESISGEMEEHGYWGSMRDRLAAAQADKLVGGKRDIVDGEQKAEVGKTTAKRVRVSGKGNLCVIRSGQDWASTLPDERKLYLETMHPVLIQGMNFLRDNGREIGCYSMNLWDVVDTDTSKADKEKTFGLGFFDDIASLEFWSKSHQTHINIFGGFLMYAKKLDFQLSLKLFHEVFVLQPDQQFFEYVNCHEGTSMLNSLGF